MNPILDQKEMTALFASVANHSATSPARAIRPQILDALQRRCEALAAEIGPRLAHNLSCKLDAQALPAIQLPYHECLLTLSRPTILCVASAQSAGAPVCIELSPSLGYFLLERMLGSDAAQPFVPPRPYTEIESRLLKRILGGVLDALSNAFGAEEPMTFSMQWLASDPDSVHLVPPGEMVAVMAFQLWSTAPIGRMTLSFPESSLDALRESLGEAEIPPTPVPCRAVLAGATLTHDELENLQPGDIITTPHKTDPRVQLRANSATQFEGVLMKLRGRRAVRIIRRCGQEAR